MSHDRHSRGAAEAAASQVLLVRFRDAHSLLLPEAAEEVMIEVRLSNGDWAEAETPEDAMFAAITLWEDATEGRYMGRAADLTATFVNVETGAIILSGIGRAAMLRSAS